MLRIFKTASKRKACTRFFSQFHLLSFVFVTQFYLCSSFSICIYNTFGLLEAIFKAISLSNGFLYLFYSEINFTGKLGILGILSLSCSIPESLYCSIYLTIFNLVSVHLVFFSFVTTYCGKRGKIPFILFLYNFEKILLNEHYPVIPKS